MIHSINSFTRAVCENQDFLFKFSRFCDIINAVRKLIDKLEFEGLV